MAQSQSERPLEALIPPPTVINDSHKVYSVAASCIALGVIATFTVLLRLGTRLRLGLMRNEDYVIVLATVSKSMMIQNKIQNNL